MDENATRRHQNMMHQAWWVHRDACARFFQVTLLGVFNPIGSMYDIFSYMNG